MAERTPGRSRRDGSRRRWPTYAVAAVVFGLALGATIVVATNLADKPTEPRSTAAWGTITNITGSTMTMSPGETSQPPYPALTIVVSPSTRFTVHAAGALSDVHSGDNVLVVGTTTGLAVAARQVIDGGTTFKDDARGLQSTPPPPTAVPAGPPPGVSGGDGSPPVTGIVNGVDGSSFTLTKPDGSTVTVDAQASTVTVLKTSSLDVLRVGDVIRVVGMGSKQTIAAAGVFTRVD